LDERCGCCCNIVDVVGVIVEDEFAVAVYMLLLRVLFLLLLAPMTLKAVVFVLAAAAGFLVLFLLLLLLLSALKRLLAFICRRSIRDCELFMLRKGNVGGLQQIRVVSQWRRWELVAVCQSQ
jgi:hypothetical protein